MLRTSERERSEVHSLLPSCCSFYCPDRENVLSFCTLEDKINVSTERWLDQSRMTLKRRFFSSFGTEHLLETVWVNTASLLWKRVISCIHRANGRFTYLRALIDPRLCMTGNRLVEWWWRIIVLNFRIALIHSFSLSSNIYVIHVNRRKAERDWFSSPLSLSCANVVCTNHMKDNHLAIHLSYDYVPVCLSLTRTCHRKRC